MSKDGRDDASGLETRDRASDASGVADEAVVEVESAYAFDETLVALVRTIEDAGMTVFARIDHAENARQAGLAMPPAVVLVYGAAKGGTPAMLVAPRAALDLPLRVLVHQDAAGRVLIAFHPMAAVLGDLGVPHAIAVRLESAQRLILKEIVR